MVKTKFSLTKLVALVISVLTLAIAIVIFPNLKKTKITASTTLTNEQIEYRRATPGLYKSGTTELIKQWSEIEFENKSGGLISWRYSLVDKNLSGDLVFGKTIDGFPNSSKTSIIELEDMPNITGLDLWNLSFAIGKKISVGVTVRIYNCNLLTQIDFSGFKFNSDSYSFRADTKPVCDISNCNTLEKLDLRGLGSLNFYGCDNLKMIILPENGSQTFSKTGLNAAKFKKTGGNNYSNDEMLPYGTTIYSIDYQNVASTGIVINSLSIPIILCIILFLIFSKKNINVKYCR